MVEPLGEARDIRDFFPELARKIGGGMEEAYQYGSTEDYMQHWAQKVPENPETGKSGLDRLLDEGAWENQATAPFYEPYNTELTAEDLAGSETDDSGLITKDGIGIGIQIGEKTVRGFKTPSRKFEIHSLFVNQVSKNQDCSKLIANSGVTKTKNRPKEHQGHDVDVDSMPIWLQIDEHEKIADNELIMTSFKWNVHNHGRTMNLKWLAEIVHSNPAWLNPLTAERFGLSDGDWIELTSYHSEMLEKASPNLTHGVRDESGRLVVNTMRVPIVTMHGIHPKAIAMSNSCGHWQYTSVAKAEKFPQQKGHLVGSDGESYRDADWERNMWWEDRSQGDPAKWQQNTGNGWNQNRLMPISPDPVTGQQAFHSTVVKIQKVSYESSWTIHLHSSATNKRTCFQERGFTNCLRD
jgi:anaerobic selenocysteine-containing dehydrogenase